MTDHDALRGCRAGEARQERQDAAAATVTVARERPCCVIAILPHEHPPHAPPA
jgi:hypothetical protein